MLWNRKCQRCIQLLGQTAALDGVDCRWRRCPPDTVVVLASSDHLHGRYVVLSMVAHHRAFHGHRYHLR